jgi:uncharacterized membrane protein YecN with MAPEG domain
MLQLPWTTLVTLLSLLLYMGTIIGVGRARVKYKIAGPATIGDPNFERHFRVQMNTLESLPIFLPALWIFALCWTDELAAALGAIWIIGRLIYWASYVRDPRSRSLGFQLQSFANVALVIGALVRVVQILLGAAG